MIDTAGEAGSLIEPGIYASLLEYYVDVLADTAKKLHIPNSEYGYSESELSAAFREADIDIVAISLRRKPFRKGISISKIAGMIAYRLSRHKVVYLLDQAAEGQYTFLLQDLAALTFVCERVLYVKPPNRVLLELTYQISRRHANQETLAVCFDIFLEFCEKIRTDSPEIDFFSKKYDS